MSSPETRNTKRLVRTYSSPIPAPPANENVHVSVERCVQFGPKQYQVDARLSGITRASGGAVKRSVGGHAKESAEVARDGHVGSNQSVARLVHLVQTGVADSRVDLVLVRGLSGFRTSSAIGGNLACRGQGHQGGRNHGQDRKQALPLQCTNLLKTMRTQIGANLAAASLRAVAANRRRNLVRYFHRLSSPPCFHEVQGHIPGGTEVPPGQIRTPAASGSLDGHRVGKR